ncbi:hypothetical protein L0Y34_01030 [Candidatus Parcubacteria bacterium]|nr:hypothetical protein [Candidatus Parcubacteria bacterium]
MSELTNLLPIDRIRAFRREYFFRLCTLGALTVALLVVIHSALLAPSYVYLSEEVKTRHAHLDGLTSALSESPEQTLSTRRQALTVKADALLSLAKRPSTSAVIQGVLSVPSDGISIRGFTVTPPVSGEGEMSISGTAATRETLRQYHGRVSALPFVTKADLPLSVYAQETDISFVITLTGTLTP